MKKSIFLSLLSGLLLSGSFAGQNLWILAWFAFVPLLLALDDQSVKKASVLSYLSGLAFWTGTIYWLVNVTLFGQILLILYLALYFGAFGFLITAPFAKARLLFIPALWVVLEYLRGHFLTGFPWALLGYSQYANLPIIQIADIAGVWLVSFLIMFVNVAIKEALVKQRRALLILALIPVVASISYGAFRLNGNGSAETLRLSVVQGNIPQELKWDFGSREFVMARYLKLTAEAKKDNPDLIVWPEASLPVILEDEPFYYERLSRYAKAIASPLLFGAVTNRNGYYYNSALLLSKEGKRTARYDKLHLVPFGEYIPWRKALPFLETIAPIGDIAKGRDYTLFNIQQQRLKIPHQFAVLICFEDVFPEFSRKFVNKGADFLINITNDAWFGKTSEAYQHLAASVFRAVENRVNLIRSANTGVSCFISPQGRILSVVSGLAGEQIFIPGYQTQEIALRVQPTFYGYYGDFFIPICLVLILYIILFTLYKQAMRKILLISLLALSAYSIINYYFADKYYFLSPISYSGDLLVRSDARGKGFFGASRRGRRIHQGIDLFAEIGTPVLAARSGWVVVAKNSRGMGNYVVIRHSLNLATIYGHLLRISVTKNQFVRQGQVVGSVGKTGNAKSPSIQPHLHFEIRKNGIPQEPLEYLR